MTANTAGVRGIAIGGVHTGTGASGGTGQGGGGLAVTGVQAALIAGLGVLFVAGGLVLLTAARVRRRSRA